MKSLFTSARLLIAVSMLATLVSSVQAAAPLVPDTQRGDRMIADYFANETAQLRDRSLANVRTADDWRSKRVEYRQQLFEMLGMDPLPARTDLKATITGKIEHDEFTVENLHFQSRPGLYVTANLYLPKGESKPVPAVLYVCGHAQVKKDGVSFGGKAHYQHHAGWFARHGYACLVIDTLQLGEIEGIHHGTYRYGRWWWLDRGYTSAGVEAWNCIRALDYLETRKEIDANRLGVTGRSGGGAYSWWIAALDERIQAAVPVAGITDLENHVTDGCVEGHCDCMFMVNTYRWDYPQVAALVAPRPLLLSNTDRDPIFPFTGVVRTHNQVRRLYELLGAPNNFAINITAGGHNDTQELQMHAFRWFDQHLKKEKRLIEKAAKPLFEPQQLRVLTEIPADQLNTRIDETFVPQAASPAVPNNPSEWEKQRDSWRASLNDKSFRGWPGMHGNAEAPPLDAKEVFSVERAGVQFRAIDFTSQHDIRLRLYVAQRANVAQLDLVVLNVMDAEGWEDFLGTFRVEFANELKDEVLPDAARADWQQTQKMFQTFPWGMAYIAPRGVGPTAWNASEKKQTQNKRRFYLLGQTLEGMQVWDVRRAIQTLRTDTTLKSPALWLQSHRLMAGVTLYASLFEPNIKRLDLYSLPTSHQQGPSLLNVLRFTDIPQTVAMAAERSQVVIYDDQRKNWDYPAAVAKKLDWSAKQLQIRKPPVED